MIRLNRSSLARSARPTAICIASLLIVALSARVDAADDQSASTCDCSCQHYTQLVDQSLPQSPIVEEERWACAAACAIAWVSCEDQDVVVSNDSQESSEDPQRAQALQASARSDIH
jgi:hypothetical protein